MIKYANGKKINTYFAYKFLQMRFLKYFGFIVLIILALFTNCAKRGTITGGPKDTLAPVILSTIPENFSTGFNKNEIQINFDEYVKLNKVNQQLIISPPMDIQPEITPMGYPSKYIKIKIFDTLKSNTTYSFNFGESIEDNNEGNAYPNYKYVFSTGSYIDSLTLQTTFNDAYSKKPLGTVNLLLYEAEGFNDSTIYKKKPLYVTTAKDSIKSASFENLKAGEYFLIALQEKNSNYKYDSKSDKIGYHPTKITVPTDSIYDLKIFNEEKPVNAYRPSMVSQNKWLAGFEGSVKNLELSVLGNNKPIEFRFVKIPQKDSIHIFTPLEKYDSLEFKFKSGAYEKLYTINQRNIKPIDTLQVKFNKSGTLQYRDTLSFTTNTPVKKFDSSLMQFYGKDSIAIDFKLKLDTINNALQVLFDKVEDEKYTFVLQPNSVTDFYDNVLKTEITQRFQTNKLTDYGNIAFNLEGNINYPIILELLDKNEKVYDFIYITEDSNVEFKAIEPAKYSVRIIEDTNSNKKWDTGNYLQKLQPEKVIHIDKIFDIRANWELNETLILP